MHEGFLGGRFNSRLREEATAFLRGRESRSCGFNSRLREEATEQICTGRAEYSEFQLTPP